MTEVLASVIVGLVVTIATHLVMVARRRIRDRRLERQYPVAGAYCTVFEDYVDETLVLVKATSVLRQRGLKLTGTTANLDDGRSWKLEGSIAPGGRIYGTYIADDPNDSGRGGFFLEITADGGLDGAWAGFDTHNKRVTSGRYRFWKAANITVRPMREQDMSEALSVLGDALGQRYVTRDELAAFVGGENEKIGLVAQRADNRVVGAATALVTTNDSFLAGFVPPAMHTRVQTSLPNLGFHRVGLLKSVAVSGASQGAGIGTALVQRTIDELWQRDATCIVAVGWTDAEGCHIGGTLVSLGFRPIITLADYWREESTEKGYSCPTCRTPCICEATLFLLPRADAGTPVGSERRTVSSVSGGRK